MSAQPPERPTDQRPPPHRRVRQLDLPGFTFTEGFHRGPSALPWHDHPGPTICFVLSGGFEERWRGGSLFCAPSTLKVTPAGERHCDRFVADVRGLLIEIKPGWIPALGPASALLDDRICSHRGVAALIARRMAVELWAPDSVTPLALEGLLLELIAAAYRQSLPVGRGDRPPWLVRARDVLHQEIAGRISLNGLAVEVGVHPVTLARRFRQAYGQSVGEYIRHLRIERASDQLLRTQLPVAHIAAMNGFTDQSHLCRLFIRTLGTTPAAYRRSAKR